MLRAEYLKIKRGWVWMTVVLLPGLAVVTGTINYINNPDTLGKDWASFTSQVTLFYGLVFYSAGVSLIVASLWRMEHRGNNWNFLLSHSSTIGSLLLTKIFVAFVLTAIMQIFLVAATLFSGLFIVRVPEGSPINLVIVSLVAAIGSLPLIALQTLLSALLKSFAAPVSLCVVGCVVGIASVTSYTLRPLSYVLPQGLIARTMSLGSTALTDSAGLNLLDAAMMTLSSLIIFGILYFVSPYIVYRVKIW